MGLSLTNLFQRPYVNPDRQTPVRRRDEDEKSSATKNAQKEEQSNQNSKSKGLNYVETKTPSYTPAYEQKFSIPANNLYNNVNIHTSTQTKTGQEIKPAADNNLTKLIDNKINIAQIIKDFRNTAVAIGTPDDLNAIVENYLSAVEKQVQSGEKVNQKLIKTTLNSAANVLDAYISETLNKDSKVVENWVDALFLQEIDFKYNEGNINERFLVKFPEGSNSEQTTRQQELKETAQEEITIQNNPKVIPITVAGQTKNTKIPQDKQLKSLFIQAKKYTYANDPENAIKSFEKALNRALEIDDTETSGKIYYEVGKIYDDYDYLAQALKSYNQSLKLSKDENVRVKAHYSMAQIYDDVNQITPAMDHYFSTISVAGVAENIPAQSASLTKIGNIYTDMYDREAFEYYNIADDLAGEIENKNLNGFVASNTAKAYVKFDEPENALKSYSKAVKNYTQAESPLKTAQNYLGAADIMVEFNNINKAYNLLLKAQKYARQTDNINLMNEINTKIKQLKDLDVK